MLNLCFIPEKLKILHKRLKLINASVGGGEGGNSGSIYYPTVNVIITCVIEHMLQCKANELASNASSQLRISERHRHEVEVAGDNDSTCRRAEMFIEGSLVSKMDQATGKRKPRWFSGELRTTYLHR